MSGLSTRTFPHRFSGLAVSCTVVHEDALGELGADPLAVEIAGRTGGYGHRFLSGFPESLLIQKDFGRS